MMGASVSRGVAADISLSSLSVGISLDVVRVRRARQQVVGSRLQGLSMKAPDLRRASCSSQSRPCVGGLVRWTRELSAALKLISTGKRSHNAKGSNLALQGGEGGRPPAADAISASLPFPLPPLPPFPHSPGCFHAPSRHHSPSLSLPLPLHPALSNDHLPTLSVAPCWERERHGQGNGMACGGEMRIVRSCCLYCPLFDIRSLVAGTGEAAKTMTTPPSPIRTSPSLPPSLDPRCIHY